MEAGMFHEFARSLPVGPRSAIEGVAQRALTQAGVLRSEGDTRTYTEIAAQHADRPEVAGAEGPMRRIFDVHFTGTTPN